MQRGDPAMAKESLSAGACWMPSHAELLHQTGTTFLRLHISSFQPVFWIKEVSQGQQARARWPAPCDRASPWSSHVLMVLREPAGHKLTLPHSLLRVRPPGMTTHDIWVTPSFVSLWLYSPHTWLISQGLKSSYWLNAHSKNTCTCNSIFSQKVLN